VQPEQVKEEKTHPYYKPIASDWLNTPKLTETNPLPKVESVSSDQIQNPEWESGDWAYLWNANGMLAKVKRPDGNEVSFEYDALGRRISKIGNKKITRYIWDGNVLLHEWNYDAQKEPKTFVDDEGNVAVEKESVENLVTWVYGGNGFMPVAQLFNGKKYSVISDYLGTPFQSYDDFGEKVWERELDIYGDVRKGDHNFIPFLYQGQYFDADVNLVYNRFRYYDVESGSYISKDPIALLGGLSLYSYVNNSNAEIDRLGLAPKRMVNDTPIFGKGQTTGPGHAELSEKIADKLANSGKFKEIHLNRSYEAMTGQKTTPRRSPDVTAIGNDGRVHAIEIASDFDMKGNNIDNLTSRNKIAQSQLPANMRGEIVIIEKPYVDADVDTKMDTLIKYA
jgi:RHS repeat-associated protein